MARLLDIAPPPHLQRVPELFLGNIPMAPSHLYLGSSLSGFPSSSPLTTSAASHFEVVSLQIPQRATGFTEALKTKKMW